MPSLVCCKYLLRSKTGKQVMKSLYRACLFVLQNKNDSAVNNYNDAIPKVGSSALSVLNLQPVFVDKDGGKCFVVPTHHLRGAFSTL